MQTAAEFIPKNIFIPYHSQQKTQHYLARIFFFFLNKISCQCICVLYSIWVQSPVHKTNRGILFKTRYKMDFLFHFLYHQQQTLEVLYSICHALPCLAVFFFNILNALCIVVYFPSRHTPIVKIVQFCMKLCWAKTWKKT